MFSVATKIILNANRHCFVGLPKSVISQCPVDRTTAIKIESDTDCLYTSWGGDVSGGQQSYSDDFVEINGLFASKHGFHNEQQVTVTVLPAVCDCISAQVEPASVDDWEILEMNALNIEATLLNQVRIVSVGQTFPIWVQRSTCIFVTVGALEPSFSISLLQQNTELIISPKARFPPTRNSHTLEASNKKIQPEVMKSSEINGMISLPQNKSNQMLRSRDTDNSPLLSNKSTEDNNFNRQSNGIISFLKSLWQHSHNTTDELNSTLKKPPLVDELLSKGFCAPFRVLALEDFMENGTSFPENLERYDLFDLSLQPSNVFISKESILFIEPSLSENLPDSFLALISKLSSPRDIREAMKPKVNSKVFDKSTLTPGDRAQQNGHNEEALDDFNPDFIVVRVVIVTSVFDYDRIGFKWKKALPQCHVLIQDDVRKMLNLEKKSRIQLDALERHRDIRFPTEICISHLFQRPDGFTDDMLLLAAKRWLENVTRPFCPLVLNDRAFFRCFIREGFIGEFLISLGSQMEPNASFGRPYCLLCPKLIQRVKLTTAPTHSGLNQTTFSLPPKGYDLNSSLLNFEQLHVAEAVKNTLVEYTDMCLCHHPVMQHLFCQLPGLANGGLLLFGAKGSGKSVVGSAICRTASWHPNYAFVEIVDCKMLKGKKPETIRQFFEQTFDELSWRQPSILFLDDLDHIAAPSAGPEQDLSGLAAYHTRVAEVIRDLMQREAYNGSLIAVIASAVSYSSIHSLLVSARGSHVFSRIVEIKPPSQNDRVEILRLLLKNRKEVSGNCIDNLNLHDIASQTEGYKAKDLDLIVNRAIHSSLLGTSGTNSGALVLNNRDFEVALVDFMPAALRSMTLLQPEELSWDDVGGLDEVKSVLVQTLQWPSKYPKLFAICPLRLRSGLLLYGAPGTGKTHLAAVIAKEFKLNFIAIKGPELFNKYIGASEQAVRDSFARAQSARPCILFFDEFDSLAPKRGHDNTGVTDRVVNQLLTQLDGVESLEGVFILAATSRPDLIDPALLRPGRLDKALHCPIPSKAERLEILHALSRKMQISVNCDFQVVADKCIDFTGADLKALLYNAQLDAIHEKTLVLLPSEESYMTSKKSNENKLQLPMSDPGTSSVVITQKNLIQACGDIQPSVSASERLRYHQIYESFVGSRGANFVADLTKNVGQHVTLA